ncbi:IS256 family transposase [Caballeronia sordidicola]|jgi:putative transposase|uniref:Mutator family transposase n=5 Tax=Caballeronia sordidicola TaxID=196367 RepID=A0A226X969_CABSO|nr:IS256 family transposase [Caballeronia sordidicola]OXC79388.1 Transposase [Caballeronia sordidicola]
MTVVKRNKRVKPDPELVKLADSLLANYQKPEDLIGENGLLKQLTKMLVERALETEMSEHLGHGKSEAVTNATGNTRNGHSAKTLQGEFGELPLDIPRERQGGFEPKLVARHQTRWTGFDDKIISLYARGLSVREIQSHLEEMYGTEVSPTLISAVTDAVSEEVKLWQGRPLDALYPIIYLDCIHVKVRDSGAVRTKAVYLAIGVNMDGHKEVLGLWIAQTEGAKFWLQVVTELKTRGVQDIFIACVDGLKGFPEAIEAVYPKAAVQLCIVHMVRNSLNYASWKLQREVAADLRTIYTSLTVEVAEQMLSAFEAKWDKDYPLIGQSWRRNWARVIPFFDYPPEIRKVIYTTNAIESINMSLRKVIKTRSSFPTDDAVMKLFYLALNNISKKWSMPIRDWKAALNRFAIQFEDRMSPG